MAKKSKPQADMMTAAPAPKQAPPPCRLSDVIGQQSALKIIDEACRSGRIHHCWIFHGPTGVGKFRAALAFAALVLDPTSEVGITGEFAPDPDSATQRLLSAGTHPDLHIVVKELALYDEDPKVREKKLITIPKDVIVKHVIEPAAMAPSIKNKSLVGKVFIVDEAELLDRSLTNAVVQNALLKTLEEPPDRTVFILVTNNENMLLPTIRSRAQRVFFGPLGEREMNEWLRTLDPRPPEDETAWLVAFAAGSPGVFCAARDAKIYSWWTRLAPLLSRLRSGAYAAETGATMAELIETYAEEWVKNHDNASKEAANHAGGDWMFNLLGHWLRTELKRAAHAKTETAPIIAAIDAVRQAEVLVGSNVNMVFVMDELAARIAAAFAGEGATVA